MDIVSLKQKIENFEKIIVQLNAEKNKETDISLENEEKHKNEIGKILKLLFYFLSDNFFLFAARMKNILQQQKTQLEKLETDLREQYKLKVLIKQLKEDITNLEVRVIVLKYRYFGISNQIFYFYLARKSIIETAA
jgi:hypothetical protein